MSVIAGMWAVAGACIAWVSAAPKSSPVEELLDPRPSTAALLLLSGLIAAIGWWAVGRGWTTDRARRRGAVAVAGGVALAYGSATVALVADEGPSPWAQLAYGGIAFGLAIAIGVAAWWASLRALAAALVGAWIVAAVAMLYDIGWQLSNPYVAPFDWCVGGMDCIGKDPSTPLGSDWLAFGALFGTLWLCIPLLVAIAGGALWQRWRGRVR